MDILVIGNGFDLAHGLPTKYQQFLEFTVNYEWHIIHDCDIPIILLDKDNYVDLYKDYFNNLTPELQNEYTQLIKGNVWVKYFKERLRKNLRDKVNWIDFETEISDVIQELDRIRKEVIKNSNTKNSQPVKVESDYSILTHEISSEGGYTIEHKFTLNTIKNKKDLLLKDLNRLTQCLELYLSDYIKYDKCSRIDFFSRMIPVYVLNFNYTDTFNQVYKRMNKDQINSASCYIHGRARSKELVEEANTVFKEKIRKEIKDKNKKIRKKEIESELKLKLDEDITKGELEKFVMDYKTTSCNLVLGIEEYLKDESKDNDNEFIEFKKFYQRIYKGTGNDYKRWLSKGKNINTIIYGHSLATTDGDIIQDLIKASKKTTIYYHSKSALHDIIINLVKIIGEEELIKRTSSMNESIVFIPTTNC